MAKGKNGNNAASAKAAAAAKAKAANVAKAEALEAKDEANDAPKVDKAAPAAVTEPPVDDNQQSPAPEAEQPPQAEKEASAPEAEKQSEPNGVSAVMVRGLQNYVDGMALNRQISEREGISNQKMLRNVIISALTVADDAEAINNIRYMLKVIHEHRNGVFSARALHRFYDIVNWDAATDRREIENILAMLTSLADPETRAAEVKVIEFSNMATVLEPRRSEMVLNRLRKAFGE